MPGRKELDDALRELTGSGINAFMQEATQWAQQAEVCSRCHGWAVLNLHGLCIHCETQCTGPNEIACNRGDPCNEHAATTS